MVHGSIVGFQSHYLTCYPFKSLYNQVRNNRFWIDGKDERKSSDIHRRSWKLEVDPTVYQVIKSLEHQVNLSCWPGEISIPGYLGKQASNTWFHPPLITKEWGWCHHDVSCQHGSQGSMGNDSYQHLICGWVECGPCRAQTFSLVPLSVSRWIYKPTYLYHRSFVLILWRIHAWTTRVSDPRKVSKNHFLLAMPDVRYMVGQGSRKGFNSLPPNYQKFSISTSIS